MSQQYVVRVCPDCNAERRLVACPLCRGEGRVGITPWPEWLGGQYPYNCFPDSPPVAREPVTTARTEREDGRCIPIPR
jgi:hypothetical protein